MQAWDYVMMRVQEIFPVVISDGVPPLPIPNREVKPDRADGTAHPRESRSPPFYKTSLETRKRLGALLRLDELEWDEKGNEEREGMMRQRGERTNSSFSPVCDFSGRCRKKCASRAKGWTKKC